MGFIIRIFRVNDQTKEATERETKALSHFPIRHVQSSFIIGETPWANTTDQQRRRRLFPNFTTSVHLILLLRAYYATPPVLMSKARVEEHLQLAFFRLPPLVVDSICCPILLFPLLFPSATGPVVVAAAYVQRNKIKRNRRYDGRQRNFYSAHHQLSWPTNCWGPGPW